MAADHRTSIHVRTNDVCRASVTTADAGRRFVDGETGSRPARTTRVGRRKETSLGITLVPHLGQGKVRAMKLIVAIAAMLCSAALTVPTVTAAEDASASESRA